SVSSYKVIASAPGCPTIDQGSVNGQGSTTDEGWVECAISSQDNNFKYRLMPLIPVAKVQPLYCMYPSPFGPSEPLGAPRLGKMRGKGCAGLEASARLVIRGTSSRKMPIMRRSARKSQTPRRLSLGGLRGVAQQQHGNHHMSMHSPMEPRAAGAGRGRTSSSDSISPISDIVDGPPRGGIRRGIDIPPHLPPYSNMPRTPERPSGPQMKSFKLSKEHWTTPATTASTPSGVALVSSASVAYEAARAERVEPRLALGSMQPPFPAMQRERFRRLPTGDSSYSPLGYDTQDESQQFSPPNAPQWIPLGTADAGGACMASSSSSEGSYQCPIVVTDRACQTDESFFRLHSSSLQPHHQHAARRFTRDSWVQTTPALASPTRQWPAPAAMVDTRQGRIIRITNTYRRLEPSVYRSTPLPPPTATAAAATVRAEAPRPPHVVRFSSPPPPPPRVTYSRSFLPISPQVNTSSSLVTSSQSPPRALGSYVLRPAAAPVGQPRLLASQQVYRAGF
ncbi:hypothetical protein FOL47_000808, partial [Perkinsus chesapeaki]